MSISLLLALLETHEPNEPDLTAEYFKWIGAQWDGKEWKGWKEERREVILRRLYDILFSHIQYMPPPPTGQPPPRGGLGTVLARTFTGDTAKDDHNVDLQEYANRLRSMLRQDMHTALEELICQYP